MPDGQRRQGHPSPHLGAPPAHLAPELANLGPALSNLGPTQRKVRAEAPDLGPTISNLGAKPPELGLTIANLGAKPKKKNDEAKKAGGAEPPAAPADPAATEPGKATGGVARAPNAPPDNIFAIDLNPLKPFLVDLPPGATRGMRTVQEGWEGVVEEIVANQPKYGDRAGITATDFNRFVALNDQHAQVVPVMPVAEKAKEVLEESLSHVDHQRHMLLSQFATSAEAHAAAEGGDPTLKTAYEKAIAYRGVSAAKAAKTKQKNEEAKKATPGPTG